MEKTLRNRCIIDWVIHLRNVKFVVEVAPLLHFFLTVLHFYTRNACSFTRVVQANLEVHAADHFGQFLIPYHVWTLRHYRWKLYFILFFASIKTTT